MQFDFIISIYPMIASFIAHQNPTIAHIILKIFISFTTT